MNKLLHKTVRKSLLMTVIMAIVLAASIVVTAIWGVNYNATANDSASLTVTVNTFFYDTKREDVESVCEKVFKDEGLKVKYQQNGEMSGDDCEIVYYFKSNANLAKAEETLEETFATKIAEEDAWSSAFITVASTKESLQTNIPVSYFVRTAIAVAVMAVLAFVYVAVRYKTNMGLVAMACMLISGVMTAAILLLTRVPFTVSTLYVIALAPLMTAVIVLFTFNNLRANMKADGAKEQSAEDLLVSSVAVKEISVFAVALAAALVLTGVIATTAVSWFALLSIIALAVSLAVGMLFAPAMYLPIKEKADRKAAEKGKNGYVGAKKTTMRKARESKSDKLEQSENEQTVSEENSSEENAD